MPAPTTLTASPVAVHLGLTLPFVLPGVPAKRVGFLDASVATPKTLTASAP